MYYSEVVQAHQKSRITKYNFVSVHLFVNKANHRSFAAKRVHVWVKKKNFTTHQRLTPFIQFDE